MAPTNEPEVAVAPAGSVPAERADLAIVGAGLIGLATALRLLQACPTTSVVVLEKEPDLAAHQSGHNSGVIHAGIYYPPGSLKARLCREGKAELEAYLEAKGIPFARVGKLVVALRQEELPRLAALAERARANGVPGVEEVSRERMAEIEPHAAGVRALWSPATGIVDFRRVTLAYADDVRSLGGRIDLGRPVTGLRRVPDGLVLATPSGDVVARNVITCAGLWSDRVAAMTRGGRARSDAARIVPFRGDYYTLAPEARPLVRGLIYPVPDPRFPFLGVHLTRRIDGQVWAGPNAVLAFAREGYRRTDLDPRELLGIAVHPGFRTLATRFWRMGLAEMWRDASKASFVAEVRRYLPAIRADQLTFGPSGVRAQALARDGTLVDDFDLGGSGRVLHVRNAPSPAATSSLAIGRVLASTAIERFDLP